MAAQAPESRAARVNITDLASKWLKASRLSPEKILISDYKPPFKDYNPNDTHPDPRSRQRAWPEARFVDATTPQGWILNELGIALPYLQRARPVEGEPTKITSAAQRELDILMACTLDIPVAHSVLARVVGNQTQGAHRSEAFAHALVEPQKVIGPSALRLMALGKVIDSMIPNDWYYLAIEAKEPNRDRELKSRQPNPDWVFHTGQWLAGGDKNLAHEALATAAQYAFSQALERMYFKDQIDGVYPRRLITMATITATNEVVSLGTGTRGRPTVGISLFRGPDGSLLDKATLRALRTVKPETVARRYKARYPY